MAKLDPAVRDHLEWLGFVQPIGLVFSAPALVRAGAILDRSDIEGQRLLRERVQQRVFNPKEDPAPWIPDFEDFAKSVLDWSFSPKAFAGTERNPIPTNLGLAGEGVAPHFAVREMEPVNDQPPWQLLVRVLAPGEDFERVTRANGQAEASEHGRMERLLRQTGVRAGVLFNGRTLRLISAPRAESSGWLDFQVADMVQTAGRPITTALRLLLRERRLLSLPRPQRLTALLEDSRKFQNEVSDRLAEQVLHALYELLRGFQSAQDASKGDLLRYVLDDDPDEIYRGLLTVILRLVFLFYTEERDMLPQDETFVGSYSLSGLYERLREDAALYPDTMEQRYGAWAQLLTLFRMIHDGARAGEMNLPKRHGVLFDPDRYPFLEGRPAAGGRQIFERIEPPLVPDGTIYRALEKLLVLDGERISYRALDVEQIGSVYETMMGFRLERATGRSVAIKAQKKRGAPTAIDLEGLLEVPPEKREKWVKERADRKLPGRVKKAVKQAASIEEVHAAFAPLIDPAATPDLVPAGAMVLQPSEERRKSGSHYTPRELTNPIVQSTLEPILSRLRTADGKPPRPEQLLELKICDPAMGSGAFLVEACRQIGDALVDSWRAYGETPAIPTDEDEFIFARRMVAQRCLYGVDKNPVAVDLSKVSLWLATLAKEHALTFVNHALRHGDSLVGLSRRQFETFHWDESAPAFQKGFEATRVRERLEKVVELRSQVRGAGEDVSPDDLATLCDQADAELDNVRLFGNLVVAAFFEGDTMRERERKRDEYADGVLRGSTEPFRERVENLKNKEQPLIAFHWPIEFPEVFDRKNPGFDAMIGNPPFAGKNSIASSNSAGYPDWLKEIHEESHGNADLVAHFFRRAFNLLRENGALGLIATNTIRQGDTRSSGLRWICLHGGEIFKATKRLKWPGAAAVVVSVVHILKGKFEGKKALDGREAPIITAFLFHRGNHSDPARLQANGNRSFQGSIVLGMGFTFDDTDERGVASPISEMHRLLKKDPRNREVIFPYIGGEEVNTSPTQAHHRFVINFGERSEKECWERWPDLMAIVEDRVKPERMLQNDRGAREKWWQFIRPRPELHAAIAQISRALLISRVGNSFAFCFKASSTVFSERLVVFPTSSHSTFATLQSRLHEVWSRFFSATLKDDLMYAPSDCFETFPSPGDWDIHSALEAAGKEYYEFRADLMVRNNEGLTKTYNRFHDPEERNPEILKLRELHNAMDHGVLGAYGWFDIAPECEFLLDYEIDEEDERERRKPWRYRWPDEVHDEVLARLLELNAERAREEQRTGLVAAKRATSRKRVPRKKTKEDEGGELFR